MNTSGIDHTRFLSSTQGSAQVHAHIETSNQSQAECWSGTHCQRCTGGFEQFLPCSIWSGRETSDESEHSYQSWLVLKKNPYWHGLHWKSNLPDLLHNTFFLFTEILSLVFDYLSQEIDAKLVVSFKSWVSLALNQVPLEVNVIISY